MTIQMQAPYHADNSWFVIAHGIERTDYERLKTHSVFGRITPFYQATTGFISGCFPDAKSQQEADDCLRFLQADFLAYGVTALNDYLESCIVDALLAGLLDDSDDWMEWGRAG